MIPSLEAPSSPDSGSTTPDGNSPPVSLLGLPLPGMDGYEVAVRLRREECCKDALIIAVSGYAEEQARHRSEESGIDHHMVKPVNINTLFSLMERP